MKKTLLILAIFVSVVIFIGCGNSNGVEIVDTQEYEEKQQLLSAEILPEAEIQNVIFEHYKFNNLNKAPKKAGSSLGEYTFLVSKNNESNIEDKIAEIGYDYIFETYDINGNVDKDMSGKITYKYIWNNEYIKWEKNGYNIETYTNNCKLSGRVITGIENVEIPVKKAKVFISNDQVGARVFETDEAGNFEIKVFVKGNTIYNVVIQHDEYGMIEKTVKIRRDYDMGNIVMSIPEDYEERATIEGLVIDRNGQPVKDAQVYVTDLNFEIVHQYATSPTEKNGVFTIGMLKRGQYYINVRAGNLKGHKYFVFGPDQIGQIINIGELKIMNSKPVIQGVYIINQPALPGQIINLSSIVTDEDNDTIKYIWTVTGGSIIENGYPNVEWKLPEEPGIYKITLKVDDGNGGVLTSTQELRLY
ncbi:MAG: carboxypeptidase regulatory-like domain-containing protein [Candidatus Muirbacterium halophilum]|nr:carboxypeptidase regulatory-like domain-containing protein [Candidatus Muirbacterium halophilum]MCK9476617.1 carboxypeptidase regulatory-like domain-containing protein [Candidatus Muirbacterium halophilum]